MEVLVASTSMYGQTDSFPPRSKVKSCGSFLIGTGCWARLGAGRLVSGYRGSMSSCFKTGWPCVTKGSERWRWYVGLFSWLAGWYGTVPLFFGVSNARHGSDSCRWNLEFGQTVEIGERKIRRDYEDWHKQHWSSAVNRTHHNTPGFCTERYRRTANGGSWQSKLLAPIG